MIPATPRTTTASDPQQLMPVTDFLPASKLRVPDVPPGCIARRRLLAELDAGVRQGIVSVRAPAGTGKTTLVSMWCQRTVGLRRHAWLSLDASDNDLTAFLRALAAALDGAVPGVGREALQMARGGRLPTHQLAIPSLLRQIDCSGATVSLILDGCDALTSPAVLHALADLLEQRPSGLSVVMISRAVTSLPLARWRDQGRLHVVADESLRFLPAEARRFLNHTMGLRLESADAAQLTERTEGWITGLQLAAISIAQAPAAVEFADRLAGFDQRVQDYFGQSVLSDQPEWIVSFLMETAILERFCAPLCDAVRGISVPIGWPSPSESALAEIERANLFLIPLDPHGRWFRYHRLFAAALVARLERIAPRHPAELRRRASRWLSEGGHAAEAIRLSTAAQPLPPGHTVPPPGNRMIEALTGREMEVLRCIATGASNHTVAEQLSISPATAKKHTSNIFAKLGVTSRTQALVQAQGLGLL